MSLETLRWLTQIPKGGGNTTHLADIFLEFAEDVGVADVEGVAKAQPRSVSVLLKAVVLDAREHLKKGGPALT